MAFQALPQMLLKPSTEKPSPAFDLVSLDGFPDEHLLSKEISADRTLIVR
jgi:hypothetical protein